ncbi:MAG: tetratricopeptide repeat protein [Thermoanaerobaculia bacterium]
MDALISAQAGTALLIQGSSLASIHVGSPDRTIPRRVEEAHLLFGEAQDLQVLEGVDRDQVVRRLTLEADSAEALQLCLILLDAELSGEIRSEAAEELDGLLAEKECRERLERVLFAHPLPQEADLLGALAHSEQAPHVQALLSQLADLQPAIEDVRNAWAGLPDALFSSPADRRRFQAALVREGLFRQLVLVHRAGAPAGPFFLTALLHPILKKLQGYRPIMQALAASFRRPNQSTKWRAQTAEVAEDKDEDVAVVHKGRRRSLDRKAAFERIEIQKKAIVSAMSASDLGRVREYVSTLVEDNLSHGGAEFAAMSLCDLAMKAKEFDLISLQLELTERSVRVKPDDGWAWAQYGDALLANGSHEPALKAFANAISFGKPDVGQVGQAEVMRSLGRFDEALTAYQAVVDRFPEEVVARNGRAEMLRELSHLEEALAAYEVIVTRFPNDVVAKTGRAETLRELGRLEEALTTYETIIAHFPNDVVVQTGRAETLRDLGRLEEALTAYEAIVARFPNNVVVKNGRAETLRDLGLLKEAFTAYEATIDRFPQNAFAKTGRAETLRELGLLEEALRAYEAVIDRFPTDVVAKNGRAETLRDLGRLEEALRAYEIIIDCFPNNVFAKTGRAETLRELGRLEEALTAYDEVIARFPHNQVARNGRASLLVSIGHWEEALKQLPSTTPAHFEDWIGYHIRGMALLRLGRLEEAEHIFCEGVEMSLPSQRDYFRSALAALKVRRREFSGASAILEGVETPALRPQVGLLRLHSFGAEGDRAKALATERQLRAERASPEVHEVREELKRRYIDHAAAHSEEWLLEREVALLLVAVAAQMFLHRRAR